MRYFIATLVLFIALPSFAQPVDPATTNVEENVKATLVDGKPFVCFTPAWGQNLLQLRLDNPKLQKEIIYLKELSDTRNKEIQTLVSGTDLIKSEYKIIADQNSKLQQTIKDMDSFWRSPVVWFAVGVVVAGATSLTIALVR